MTATISRPARIRTMPTTLSPGGPNSHGAISVPVPIEAAPRGSDSRPTDQPAIPRVASSAGPDFLATAGGSTPKKDTSRGIKPAGCQANVAAQCRDAAGSNFDGQSSCDTPDASAVDQPGPTAKLQPIPTVPVLLDPALCLAADILDDIERVRTANENRLRQMTRTGEDADGAERGFGLTEDHPDVARLAAIVDVLTKVEHDAELNLGRQLRRHPLGAWVKTTKGVGAKQGARLLAAVGDPYINSAKNAPRTVSALWAYCGLDPRDGVARKRRKGELANWSGKAKMRAYLIAESCVKQLSSQCRDGHPYVDAQANYAVPAPRHNSQAEGGQRSFDAQLEDAAPACACSPYRVIYDQRRAHTTTTRPEWTAGHSHNDALRVASKEILKDLWRAARDWHQAEVTR